VSKISIRISISDAGEAVAGGSGSAAAVFSDKPSASDEQIKKLAADKGAGFFVFYAGGFLLLISNYKNPVSVDTKFGR